MVFISNKTRVFLTAIIFLQIIHSSLSLEEEDHRNFLSGNLQYYNRELSWLDFNIRILEEAKDKNHPLIERLRFLSITASNLDEFCIVRVAALKDMQSSGNENLDVAGFTTTQQLERINIKIHDLLGKMHSALNTILMPAMKEKNIYISSYDSLDSNFKTEVDQYFKKELIPILTPLRIDHSLPVPLVGSKMINIAVMMKSKNRNELEYYTVQIPSIIPRMYKIQTSGKIIFVPVEDIVRHNLDLIFEGKQLLLWGYYRIMRNAGMSIDEDDAVDLLKEIEKNIDKRRFGEIIRMEVSKDMDERLLKVLVTGLMVKKEDVMKIDGILDLTVLSKICSVLQKIRPELAFTPHDPAEPAMFNGLDHIFDQIREKDRIAHYPYESFNPLLELLRQASIDPNVLQVKMALYRVSDNSPIIQYLLDAANNGKDVMVLLELKARFDEEHNVKWSRMLEKAGCSVIYGPKGLKTHSKITLVVRREPDKIRRYLNLATGNYNDVTAKIYTDFGLFTAQDSFGDDGSSFFNMVAGYSLPQTWNKLIPAPFWMKDFFYTKIKREAENARNGKPAYIIAKMNALVEPFMIKELYLASMAGVKIDLIVRGICCLIAGKPGMSENISVRSITGRYLEHSRVYYFYNNGQDELFLASADWMPRNLNRRVELLFPVEDKDCKKRVLEVLELQLNDNARAHILLPDGNYEKPSLKGKKRIDCQEELMKISDNAVADRKK